MEITIGISFYNAECYLEYAILSVINQTLKDWRLILLDDGSTDGSLSIAKSFNDDRIEVYSDGINRGLVARLNQLTSMVQSPYYARMDADDIMHPNRLEQQLGFLKSHPDIDVVGSSVYFITNNNTVYSRKDYKKNPCEDDVYSDACFAHPSVTGKTSWFKANTYDNKAVRMEDFDLWLRTINKSNFANINTPLLFYRDSGTPHLKKYLLSQKNGIKVLLKHNKYLYILKSIFKCLIYLFVYTFKIEGFLFKIKHIKLDEIECDKAKEDLCKAIINRML